MEAFEHRADDLSAREVAVPAIAQDWLAEAGSRWVTVELSRLLPTADNHTSFFDPRIFGGAIDPARVRTWPLNRVPAARRRFRSLLLLYPIWFSLVDLRDQPLVISSFVAFTHAVRPSPRATHISSRVHAPALCVGISIRSSIGRAGSCPPD